MEGGEGRGGKEKWREGGGEGGMRGELGREKEVIKRGGREGGGKQRARM